jgi:hypothetical protein
LRQGARIPANKGHFSLVFPPSLSDFMEAFTGKGTTMTGFDSREKSFENKYAKDEEFRFRVNAKAVKLFGLWAAAQLGRADAEAYADEVVDADFDEPGIQDVLRKVKKDFAGKGIETTEHHLENQFKVHLAAAMKALG